MRRASAGARICSMISPQWLCFMNFFDESSPFYGYSACCFTGHRPQGLPQNDTAAMKLLRLGLMEAVQLAAAGGVTRFSAGGARGFDMLAAEAVLLLRQRESLPLSLFLELPSPRQPEGWPASERQRYEHILAEADGYRYASFRNDATAMFARNRRLVERSDCCIAYLARPSGGTFYTVNYALTRGLFVYQLAERLRP